MTDTAEHQVKIRLNDTLRAKLDYHIETTGLTQSEILHAFIASLPSPPKSMEK